MDLDLRKLRYFVAVADRLHFSRAADALHIAQPALSRQIRALERLVGCELLRRSTHRVELTVAGSALLDRARRLLGDLILTRALGHKVAAALGDRNALFLVNHGIVTVGPDVPTAVLSAVLLERACRMQLVASSAGELVHWSSDDEALAKRDHCYPPELLGQAWAYLVRRLG